MKAFNHLAVGVFLLCGPTFAQAPIPNRVLSAVETQALKAESVRAASVNLPATVQLPEAIRGYFNLQAGRRIDLAATPIAERAIQELRLGGFLRDERYARNALTVMSRPGIRIVNGDLDTRHPDCVAVGASRQVFCCSGTLIAPQVVVTAGHCLPDCGEYVLVGGKTSDPEAQIIKVRKAVRHPGYERYRDPTSSFYEFVKNDLTVLILEETPRDVAPRRVAQSATIDNAEHAWLVGFGRNDTQGADGFGTRRIGGPVLFATASDPMFGAFPDIEFVLANHPANIDTCSGDSGGPVYIEQDGRDVVAGATSRSTRNSQLVCGDGGNYVRLDKFLPWIATVARDAGVAAPTQ